MIQSKVVYWESQERETIEEYAKEKSEADTDAEDMMRETSKVIDRERAESKSKERDEDDIRKQVWRAKSLGLRNSKS